MGIVLFLVCAWLAYCAIRDARAGSWAGPRTPAMRGRASAPRPAAKGRGKAVRRTARTAAGSAGSAVLHPSNRGIRAQARADAHRLWTEARTTDWLEGQRHARANGTTPAAGGTATATRPTIRQRLRLVPFVAQRDSPASGGSNGSGQQTGTGPQPAPQPAPPNGTRPANGNGGHPARPAPPPAPPPPAPSGSNGGTTMAAGTSTASAEKAIEGLNELHAHAVSGGIHAKQEGLKSIHEVAVRAAGMVVTLARQMSEPGMNYGPEITEPLATAGNHFHAAATTVSESDAAISTLINMSVGALATSARQAPHHGELSENGSR